MASADRIDFLGVFYRVCVLLAM